MRFRSYATREIFTYKRENRDRLKSTTRSPNRVYRKKQDRRSSHAIFIRVGIYAIIPRPSGEVNFTIRPFFGPSTPFDAKKVTFQSSLPRFVQSRVFPSSQGVKFLNATPDSATLRCWVCTGPRTPNDDRNGYARLSVSNGRAPPGLETRTVGGIAVFESLCVLRIIMFRGELTIGRAVARGRCGSNGLRMSETDS